VKRAAKESPLRQETGIRDRLDGARGVERLG
jgi:hypothetical protein